MYTKVPKQGGGHNYYYYHYDGSGNVICITDSDKDIMALYEYDAFGNIITKCGSLANDFLFSTQLSNSNAGWHMYMFRSYDPQLGRWTQRDPIGIDGRNLYHFVHNDPVNFIDILGLAEPGFFSRLFCRIRQGIRRNIEASKKGYNEEHPYLAEEETAWWHKGLYFTSNFGRHLEYYGRGFGYRARRTAEWIFSPLDTSNPTKNMNYHDRQSFNWGQVGFGAVLFIILKFTEVVKPLK